MAREVRGRRVIERKRRAKRMVALVFLSLVFMKKIFINHYSDGLLSSKLSGTASGSSSSSIIISGSVVSSKL